MIDVVTAIVTSIIDMCVSIFGVFVKLTASFFVGAGQTLGAIDVFLVLFVVFMELFVWLTLYCIQMIIGLCKWRRPKKVSKPLFWRPQPKVKTNNR